MNENIIRNFDDYNEFIKSNKCAVLYFSMPECNVCKVLKPKLVEMIEQDFSLMKFAYTDTARARELAAQLSVLPSALASITPIGFLSTKRR